MDVAAIRRSAPLPAAAFLPAAGAGGAAAAAAQEEEGDDAFNPREGAELPSLEPLPGEEQRLADEADKVITPSLSHPDRLPVPACPLACYARTDCRLDHAVQ